MTDIRTRPGLLVRFLRNYRIVRDTEAERGRLHALRLAVVYTRLGS